LEQARGSKPQLQACAEWSFGDKLIGKVSCDDPNCRRIDRRTDDNRQRNTAEEFTMNTRTSLDAIAVEELPAFPMQRKCPFSPTPEYARLREEEPVAPVRLWDGRKAWLISRYDDVRKVLSDRRISNNILHPGFPLIYEARAAVFRQYDEPPYFHFMDPPKHTEHRRMVTRDFIVSRIRDMEPQVQGVVDELIDAMLASEERPVDLVSAISLPLPTRIISGMLGVPYEDTKRLQLYTDGSSAFSRDPEEAKASAARLAEYIRELINRKEKAPSDDIVSRLIVEQVKPGHISGDQLIRLIRFLLTVGHETTASMISLGMMALLQNDTQRMQLQNDPALAPQAVEELLRYLSIVHLTTCRVALEDIEISGTKIRAGEGIVALISSANRDSTQFEAPDEINIHREGRNHLAFGFGVHQCLGQSLARLEMRLAFTSLLRRIPTLRMAAPIESLAFKDYINGVQAMPVTW
jgi:cytochrome P450